MSPLSLDVPQYVQHVGAEHGARLDNLRDEPLIAISSVLYADLCGYNGKRFNACVAASAAYQEAGIPQIVMVDQRSHPAVVPDLAKNGALVVLTPKDRQGVATPYLDAAQIARFHGGPRTSVLKAEADKLMTRADLMAIDHALGRYEIVVGDRSQRCLESMTPMQQRTESLIDAILAEILDIPRGASSGVQAYSPKGLTWLLEYEHLLGKLGNTWKYLLYAPAAAVRNHREVGGVKLDFCYDPEMVKAEEDDLPTTAKRADQLMLMLEGAFEVQDIVRGDGDHCYKPPTNERKAAAADQWQRLIKALAG